MNWQNFWQNRSWTLRIGFLLGLPAIFLAGYLLISWKPKSKPGEYESTALKLNKSSKDACDVSAQEKRLFLATLIDTYRRDIQALWRDRKSDEFPGWKMEQVGPVFLRVNKNAENQEGYESSVWSWEGSLGTYWDTQNRADRPEVKQSWRDLDTAVRYLLENDSKRILLKKPLLEPELTTHNFRTNPGVTRDAKFSFSIKLDAGDFAGSEDKLASMFEREWNTKGYSIKIIWVKNDPAAYRLLANFRSGRSLVNHKEKVMIIANFAWTRTLAHELGHILGFDDHYYSVWNGRNCYYTQKSRVTDLMSNSEQGKIGTEHWRLLDLAYPFGRPPLAENFSYKFGSK